MTFRFQDVIPEIEHIGTVVGGVCKFGEQIAADIVEAKDDPSKLIILAQDLRNGIYQVANAVKANTPAASEPTLQQPAMQHQGAEAPQPVPEGGAHEAGSGGNPVGQEPPLKRNDTAEDDGSGTNSSENKNNAEGPREAGEPGQTSGA